MCFSGRVQPGRQCKTVITGSWDVSVRLWDATTGKPVGQPLAHKGRVSAVAFSPNGKSVLTGSDDNTVQPGTLPPGKSIKDQH